MKSERIAVRRTEIIPMLPIGLAPADKHAQEVIGKLKIGQEVFVSVYKARSIRQHRLFWALLTHVAEASKWETPEQLLVGIKIALGRYDLMALASGKVVPVPHSISFESMSQAEFKRFFDQSVDLICREVLPDINRDELIRDVEAMLGQNS